MQEGSESITHAVTFTNHDCFEGKHTKRNVFDRENIEKAQTETEIKVLLQSLWSVLASP